MDISQLPTPSSDLLQLLHSMEGIVKKSLVDDAVKKFKPETLKQLESFTGSSANFYRLEATLTFLNVSSKESLEMNRAIKAALSIEAGLFKSLKEVKKFLIAVYGVLLKKNDPRLNNVRYLLELNLQYELEQIQILKTYG